MEDLILNSAFTDEELKPLIDRGVKTFGELLERREELQPIIDTITDMNLVLDGFDRYDENGNLVDNKMQYMRHEVAQVSRPFRDDEVFFTFKDGSTVSIAFPSAKDALTVYKMFTERSDQ